MALFSLLYGLPTHVVLGGAFACMALLLVGGIVRAEASEGLGNLLRLLGNAGLVVTVTITVVQLGGAAMGLPVVAGGVAMAAQGVPMTLRGRETRVALAPDGHYWVDATINGVAQRFLIDTGATYTTISADVARDAMISPGEDSAISLHTANGDTPARMADIASLEVGAISARDMKAIIAPALGTTNVLGMNFLTSLDGWRVEDKVLILSPKKDQD